MVAPASRENRIGAQTHSELSARCSPIQLFRQSKNYTPVRNRDELSLLPHGRGAPMPRCWRKRAMPLAGLAWRAGLATAGRGGFAAVWLEQVSAKSRLWA